MKVFVTGVNGQLGHDVMNSLYYAEIDAIGSDIKESYSGVQDGSPACTMPYIGLDLTDEEKTRKIITEEGIDAIIHCAAWTAVDAAEESENQAIVEKINGEVPGVLARIMKERDGKLLYLSTDYVFSGEGTEPWSPDETNFSPINFYGKTKLMGEEKIREVLEKYFIVRIAWVFGLNGKNFIKTMLKVGKSHEEVRVVNDQIGNPTYTLDLAELLVDMICTEKYGNYHATNEGDYISWYDFTKEIYLKLLSGLSAKEILDGYQNEEEKYRKLVKLYHGDLYHMDLEKDEEKKLFSDYIRQLKLQNIEAEIKEATDAESLSRCFKERDRWEHFSL